VNPSRQTHFPASRNGSCRIFAFRSDQAETRYHFGSNGERYRARNRRGRQRDRPSRPNRRSRRQVVPASMNQARLTSGTRGDRRLTRRIDYLISASVRVRRPCSPVPVRRFRSNTNESSSYPMSAFRIGSFGGYPVMWPAGPAAKTQPDDPDASFIAGLIVGTLGRPWAAAEWTHRPAHLSPTGVPGSREPA
jgi:hypothetical protein